MSNPVVPDPMEHPLHKWLDYPTSIPDPRLNAIAAVRAAHRRQEFPVACCSRCRQNWPCEVARLGEALDTANAYGALSAKVATERTAERNALRGEVAALTDALGEKDERLREALALLVRHAARSNALPGVVEARALLARHAKRNSIP